MVNDRTKKGSTSQARFLLRKRNNERQPLDSFKRIDKRFNWINCQSIKKNRGMTRWPFLRKGSFVLSAIGGRPHEMPAQVPVGQAAQELPAPGQGGTGPGWRPIEKGLASIAALRTKCFLVCGRGAINAKIRVSQQRGKRS